MMASDAASGSSNPSLTKARVSASRQWPKILPATEVSCGSSSARADRRRDHRAARREITFGQELLPELDELTDQLHATPLGGLIDDPGDRIAGILKGLDEDLVPAPGEVVVHRPAAGAAAGEHLVDRHAGGTALAHHLGGADQHVVSRRTSLGSRLGCRHAARGLRSRVGRQATLRCARRSSDWRRSGTRCVNWRPAKLSSMTHIVCLL